MGYMAKNLHAELTDVITRYLPSKNQEPQDILMELAVLLHKTGTPEYQYRNHPAWDTTWMDLDEAQIAVVLKHDHTVERRLILGDWEAVTEAPA